MASGKSSIPRVLARMAYAAARRRLHAFWMALRFDYAMVSDAVDQARKEQRRGR